MRIEKLQEYLYIVLDELLSDNKYIINADFLDKEPNNYTIDKIGTSFEISTYINGSKKLRDVYSFRSRNSYTSNNMNNLKNVGFYETFQTKIEDNNDKQILPDIKGIESIKTLNSPSMITADSTTSIFEIQIEIIYKKEAV